jgi:DNA-binding SARP family transcriptional activator
VTANAGIVDLPSGGQRLIALLALHARPLQRMFVAGTLWPDAPEDKARGRLRSALWRLHQPGLALVDSRGAQLGLSSLARVDVTELLTVAHRLGAGQPVEDLEGLPARFELELLPDWYDDWLIEWRERWRQVRLHALECLARRLVNAGAYHQAVEAGLAAVRAEPLRESAHRAVIQVHIAEGNHVEAVRQYQRYRDLLESELGIDPSPLMAALMGGRIG